MSRKMFYEDTEKEKKPVLFQAIENNDLIAVEALIQSGVALDQKDSYGCSPMQAAVAFGNVEIAKSLLRAGAKLDCLNEHIFDNAVYYRRLDVVSFLIEMGIDVNLKFEEDEERTALIQAALVGDIKIVKKLVNSGADVNAVSRKNEYALMNAAFKGWQEIYDYLAPRTSPELLKWVKKLYPKMMKSN